MVWKLFSRLSLLIFRLAKFELKEHVAAKEAFHNALALDGMLLPY